MEYTQTRTDFLSATILTRYVTRHRQIFDPENIEHLTSAQKFINTGSWGNTQFLVEYPYVDVPTTVLMKFAKHSLNAAIKDTTAR